MISTVNVNSDEFGRMGEAFKKLPTQIKTKAFGRALRRVTTQSRTAVIKENAKRINVQQKFVRDVTSARFNSFDNSIEVKVKSGWISLYKLGATKTSRGVKVRGARGRGSYDQAFIATMSNGNVGVFKRSSKNSLPIKKLYGPNPASDIVNSPDAYLDIMLKILDERIAGRLEHELMRLLRF